MEIVVIRENLHHDIACAAQIKDKCRMNQRTRPIISPTMENVCGNPADYVYVVRKDKTAVALVPKIEKDAGIKYLQRQIKHGFLVCIPRALLGFLETVI